MPNTTWLQLPYPGLSDAPNGPAQIQALALALDGKVTPTAYTPTWTATGTAPVVGNGTLTGQFVRTGLEIDFEMQLKFGTTTTPGTGQWSFALPVGLAAVTDWPWPIGTALFRDDSAASYLPGVVTLASASTMQVMFPFSTGPTYAFTTSTQPVAWANIDFLRISGRYRVTS